MAAASAGLNKSAADGGRGESPSWYQPMLDYWGQLPDSAKWGIAAGVPAALTGAFSEHPLQSMLTRGLIFGGLGAGAGYLWPYLQQAIKPDFKGINAPRPAAPVKPEAQKPAPVKPSTPGGAKEDYKTHAETWSEGYASPAKFKQHLPSHKNPQKPQ